MAMEKTADLVYFHKNARKGDVDAIAGSLEELGQYKPIVVNRGTHTGRPMEVLAGNNTLEAANKLDWDEIEVYWVDVDDTTATKINLADNKTHDMGGYDAKALADLMSDLPDLEGTGYVPADLDALLRETASLADHALNQFSAGLQQAQAQQAPAAPAPAPASSPEAAAAQATTSGEATTTTPTTEGVATPYGEQASQPLAQQAPAPAAPAAQQDQTVYFTLQYTVTAEQREVIQAALKKVQAELGNGTVAAAALVEICKRVTA